MKKQYIAGVLSTLILAGCASSVSLSEKQAELLSDPRVGAEVNKVCFSRSIDGFRENHRGSVVLTRGVSDHFLVLVSGCPSLDRAQSIGLANKTSCLRRSDRLEVSDSVFSPSGSFPGVPDSCFIDSIFEWNENVADEEAALDEEGGTDLTKP